MAKASVDRQKILQSLKARTKGAFKKSATKAPVIKGSTLPGGIVNGIAIFSSWKMDKDKKGDPYVSLTGIVVEPAECKGARCTKMHFIKAGTAGPKPKTVADKVDDLCSDVQLIGGEGCLEGLEDIDQLPEILDGFVASKPAYRFNTWLPPKTKQNPNPSVIIFLQGPEENYEAPAEDEEVEEVVEETEGEEETEKAPKATHPAPKTASKPANRPNPKPTPKKEEVEEIPEEEETEEVEEVPEESEEGTEETPWVPQKGEVYAYKFAPKGPLEECQILKTDEEAQTVSIKRVKDGKVVQGVSWDSLQNVEE